MDLTKEFRAKTGAFYTPAIWANLAVEKIREVLVYPEDYIFYDPAAGEGALLEALPDWVEKYGTTLESKDVLICQAKGLKVLQQDFFSEDIYNEFTEEQRAKLVIFMNPPYFKLPANNDCFAKRKYETHDSVALFYYRIIMEIRPYAIFSFNKLDLLQSSMLNRVRRDLNLWEIHYSTFLTPSKSWGLKGNFPIAFQMFFPGQNFGCYDKICADVYGDSEFSDKNIHRYT